jgi:hypothetical protein
MILEEIRKQIKKCRLSRYRISKDTGIDQAALCRIMQGKSCNVETADELLEYFDLKLANKYS